VSAPTLEVSIDFTGNPTAGYYDTLTNAAGAVSYWRMASTSALTDALGANSGTLPVAPSLVSGALPYDADQALSFNGSTTYATVPSSSTLLQSGSYTVEGWLRFPSLPGATRTIFTKGSFRLEIQVDNRLAFTVKNEVGGTVTTTSCVGNSTLSANAWYHVACVHDATLDQLRLYVNGVQETTVTHTAGTELWGLPLLFAAKHSATPPSFGTTATTAWASSVPSATSIVLNAPASIATGDLLLAHINGSPGVVTPPAGWAQLAGGVTYTSTTNKKSYVFWKVAAGGDVGATTYTFTTDVNNGGQAAISRFTGCDTAQPFANPPYTKENVGTGTSHTTGPHLPLADDVLITVLVSGQSNNTWTSSDGTERYDTDGAGGQGANGIAMYTSTQASAASYTLTATSSFGYSTGQGSQLVTLFLKGSDAQNFTSVQLDEWSFEDVALDADTVQYRYEGRLSGVGAWVNVTPDVRAVQTKFGRQYELNRMEAGTASVTLNDFQRRYDPANGNSPYYPNVIPMRKIRIRVLHNGTYYPIYRGFVERWPPRWQGPNIAEVTVTCVDGFETLALAGASGTLTTALSGKQITALLDEVPWPEADRALDSGVFVMAETSLSGDVKGYVESIADSELGIFFFDQSGIATFHDRGHRWTTASSTTAQAVFRDNGGEVVYQELEPSFDKDTTINEWLVSDARSEQATARDEVSVRRNFKRTQTRSTSLDSFQDAQTQAVALLQQSARPGLRFDQLTVIPTTDNAWQKVLSLDMSDRVNVIRNPVPAAGGTSYAMDCFVEGISWNFRPGPNGTVLGSVSFQLSPVSGATYYDTIIRDRPVSYWRMGV
jgi:hypothetical protein